jgi:H/ACA ribonucleoprotein complex subunit 3
MNSLIRKCRKCNTYTLEEHCARCGMETVPAIPPKYSPVDRFQKYRIMDLKGEMNGKDSS